MADLYFTNYIYNYLYFNIIKECSNIYNIRRRVVAGLLGFESHGSYGGKFILSHNGPCRWVSRAGHGRQAPSAKLRNNTGQHRPSFPPHGQSVAPGSVELLAAAPSSVRGGLWRWQGLDFARAESSCPQGDGGSGAPR